MLRTNQIPAVCDVYQVNGLVQIHGDPYSTDWKTYSALLIMTLGLAEVVTFPYVAMDMTARSFCRYELRAWYDTSDQLIAYERRKRRVPD